MAQPSTFKAPIDYSYCGYHLSEKAVPDAPCAVAVDNSNGDSYSRLQQAIDYVSGLKPDKNGIRGAVLLGEGTYRISEPLRIHTSGVVIRGCGTDKTTLLKTGPDRGAAIYIEGADGFSVSDTIDITADTQAGAMTITTASPLKQGEEIVILRPSTKEWIASLGCQIFGGGIDWTGWKPGDIDILWSRTVESTQGNSATLDAPLTLALQQNYGGGKALRCSWTGRVEESGVENLCIAAEVEGMNISTDGTPDNFYGSDKNGNGSGYNRKDEDHCWDGIYIANAKNCWVRKVMFHYLAGSAVIVQRTAQQITVEDCISEMPVSEIAGFRRRAFFTLGEKCLFQRLYSRDGIADFSAGYCAAGPNAFVQCDSENSLGYSGSIGSWASGLLFDIVNIDGNDLKLANLGQEKYGAGWNAANSTLYQCTASCLYCYSPDSTSKNYAYGCWGQFEGNGEWAQSNNHVQPRSIFYSSLAARMDNGERQATSSQWKMDNGKWIMEKGEPRLLDVMAGDATSSPTIEQAKELAAASRTTPRLTMRQWILDAPFTASTSAKGVKKLKDNENANASRASKSAKPNTRDSEYNSPFSIIHYPLGDVIFSSERGALAGKRHNAPWWSGRIKYNFLPQAQPALTRFVPGQEGQGLTDRIDSVVNWMERNHVLMIRQNYGLWYDLRRDDHERMRRKDGDVWCPLYEQPFARSGEGIAWDGLSKYDLTKPNKYYFYRLRQFADKGAEAGLLLLNQHFFQHNIIEAGAHWVDCPWRPVNNINGTGDAFPEPVPFAGDKRVFMAEQFYDISNANLRQIHEGYIRMSLDAFKGCPNVIHQIGEEFTGPYHFAKFWLETVAKWAAENNSHPIVSLCTTKDVQDSIMQDETLRKGIDIICIEQWFYHSKGLFAPPGGVSMAPRQYLRKQRPGGVRFEDVYHSVAECKLKYPEKAVMYFAQRHPEMAWAAFMAGGSCTAIPVTDKHFLQAAAEMKPVIDEAALGTLQPSYMLKGDKGMILYLNDATAIPDIPQGSKIYKVDKTTGEVKKAEKVEKNDVLIIKFPIHSDTIWDGGD